MNKADAVIKLYPNAKPGVDFTVRDDSDGKGQYIDMWNLPQPQPTEAELAAAWELVKNVSPAPSNDDRLKTIEDWILDKMMGGV